MTRTTAQVDATVASVHADDNAMAADGCREAHDAFEACDGVLIECLCADDCGYGWSSCPDNTVQCDPLALFWCGNRASSGNPRR